MGLRAQAAADAKKILNDATSGAGWRISIYDPSAPTVAVPFVGFTNDISFVLDPDTDDFVTGRRASIAVSLTDIEAASLSGIPDAVPDTAGRPWVVEFVGLDAETYKFKVAQSMPDRTLNVLVLDLEAYQLPLDPYKSSSTRLIISRRSEIKSRQYSPLKRQVNNRSRPPRARTRIFGNC